MALNGYRIQVQGHLTPEWADWFEGLLIQCWADGTTTLSGPVRDQAALQGLLVKVWDLGLSLISVNPIELTQDGDRAAAH
jgi:hypothetical protein